MRVRPRVLFMEFLLAVSFAVSGCQPVQPVSTILALPVNEPVSEVVVESEPVPDTATATLVTATVDISTTHEISAAEISATGAASPADTSALADPALLAAGLTVYRAQYCGVCHTLDAAETRGTFGPAHDGMGAIAAERLQDENYRGTAMTAAAYIRESIVDPQVYVVPGYAATSHRMPTYAHLDSGTLDALVAFLLAQ